MIHKLRQLHRPIAFLIALYWLLIPFGAFADNTYVVDIPGTVGNNLTTASDDDIDLVAGAFTIEFWVDADAWAGGGSTAMLSNYNAGNVGYKIYCQASGQDCFFQEDDTTNYIGAFDIPTDTWHHVVWVFDGTDLKSYYATTSATTHVLDHNAAYSPAHGASDGNLKIGNLNNNFNGQMDELRMWNVARSLAQLDANFKTELCGNETGLILYHKFENNFSDSQTNVAASDFTETGTVPFLTTSPDPPFTTAASCGGAAGAPLVDAIIWWESD